MPGRVLIIACVLGVCGSAAADDVQIRKLTYCGVKVVAAAGGEIRFRGPGRNLIVKPITEVTSVLIEHRPAFNKAEQLLVQGKFTEAVSAYDRALVAKSGWLAKLIRYRRLVALNEAQMTDRATEEWLLLGGEPGAGNVLSLRPTKFAPKGSKQNASAIALLTRTRKRIRGNEPYATAVDHLLLDLCQHEDMKAAAAVLASEILATRPVASDRSVKLDPYSVEGQLKAMAVLISAGDCQQVLQDIETNLRSDAYGVAQLPWAIVLAGRARQKLAERAQGAQRRKLLIGAGLDFMRVVTFFPGSARAPEAMLEAGEINASLGNSWAAENAWRMVIKNYPATEPAQRAAAAIEAMRKRLRNARSTAPKRSEGHRDSVKVKETAK